VASGGGPPEVVATFNPPQYSYSGELPMLASGSTLFLDEGWTISSIPTGGGAWTTLASSASTITGLVVDATNLFWTEWGTPDASDGRVLHATRDGGAPTTLASGRELPRSLVSDGVVLAWIEGVVSHPDRSKIVMMPIAGGVPKALVTTDATGDLMMDATSMYWVATRPNSFDGWLYSVDRP
jgi:hypothetical protein